MALARNQNLTNAIQVKFAKTIANQEIAFVDEIGKIFAQNPTLCKEAQLILFNTKKYNEELRQNPALHHQFGGEKKPKKGEEKMVKNTQNRQGIYRHWGSWLGL